MSDIFAYNSSALVAMTGKDCVAIASDTRFGIQHQTMSTDMERIFPIHERLYVGFSGLITDVQTLSEKLTFRNNIYKLKEERDMQPEVFSTLLSNMLYEKRFGPFFVEPVVAGLRSDGQPFVCSMDLIGALEIDNFAVCGTAYESLFGICEAYYKPNLEADELFEVISQCLMAGFDRDSFSGWGAEVIVITPEKVIKKNLRTRMD